jgi:hypothetical protein
MAKRYARIPVVKLLNRLMGGLTCLGVGPTDTCRLTVTGHTSAKPHTTPVFVFGHHDDR